MDLSKLSLDESQEAFVKDGLKKLPVAVRKQFVRAAQAKIATLAKPVDADVSEDAERSGVSRERQAQEIAHDVVRQLDLALSHQDVLRRKADREKRRAARLRGHA